MSRTELTTWRCKVTDAIFYELRSAELKTRWSLTAKQLEAQESDMAAAALVAEKGIEEARKLPWHGLIVGVAGKPRGRLRTR